MGDLGRLIVFEGGEGSGKSTQAELLANHLGAMLTREPGGTALGEVLRSLAIDQSAGPIDPRTELLLMVASRAEHVASKIRPALAAGTDVVCDRFSGSTVAYQGYGRGLPIEDVLVACELATNGLEPDVTVLLEVPSEIARRRRSGPDDPIEAAGAEFHDRVADGFAALARADAERWVVVDGDGDVAEVAQRVLDAIEPRLRANAPSVRS